MNAKTLQDANAHIKYTQLKTKDGLKDYAEVKERIKAFRAFYADFTITTEIISMEGNVVTMKATVIDPDGRVIATGHAQEEKGKGLVNSTSHVENCETSAIGRALANFGIGVDAAYASADEMVNAIKSEQQQLAMAQENPNMSITKKQLESVRKELATVDITEADLCKFEGIEKLEDMTITQLWALLPKWTESIDKIKALKRLGK